MATVGVIGFTMLNTVGILITRWSIVSCCVDGWLYEATSSSTIFTIGFCWRRRSRWSVSAYKQWPSSTVGATTRSDRLMTPNTSSECSTAYVILFLPL